MQVDDLTTLRIMRIAFMSGATSTSRRSGLPEIDKVFHDNVELWVGYPLTASAVPHRPTSYLRDRCRLAEVFEELHKFVFVTDDQRNLDIRTFASEAARLSTEMRHWYQRLPVELHYQWPMSVAVWELQFVQQLIL